MYYFLELFTLRNNQKLEFHKSKDFENFNLHIKKIMNFLYFIDRTHQMYD